MSITSTLKGFYATLILWALPHKTSAAGFDRGRSHQVIYGILKIVSSSFRIGVPLPSLWVGQSEDGR